MPVRIPQARTPKVSRESRQRAKLRCEPKIKNAVDVESSTFSLFNAEGEFTGSDKASMKIKSECKPKILELIGSPLEYDAMTRTFPSAAG